MSCDVSKVTVDGAGREFRGEAAEWRALMADFERWDGSQVNFCEARDVPRKTFRGWRLYPGSDRKAVHAVLRRSTLLSGGHEINCGKGIFARDHFARMAEIQRGLKGRFILCINDRPEVRETFGEFRFVDVEDRYSANGSATRRVGGTSDSGE